MASPKILLFILGSTQFAIDEYYRNFNDFEAALISREFHLNLKGVSFEADVV